MNFWNRGNEPAASPVVPETPSVAPKPNPLFQNTQPPTASIITETAKSETTDNAKKENVPTPETVTDEAATPAITELASSEKPETSGTPKLSPAERRQKRIAELKAQVERAENVLKVKQSTLAKVVRQASGEPRKKRNAQIYAVGGAIAKYYRECQDEAHRTRIKEICLANTPATNREKARALFDAIDEDLTAPQTASA
ncbi:hypothetical protein FACS1894139_18100 [Planctomycetales bacterium]|nr:hypothetical protein FACS1894139_18100 [Planctomycetales bacterium]